MKKIICAIAVLMLTACGSGRQAGKILQASQPDTVKTPEADTAVNPVIIGSTELGAYGHFYAVKVTDHDGVNHTVVVIRNSAADGGVAVCELRGPEGPDPGCVDTYPISN